MNGAALEEALAALLYDEGARARFRAGARDPALAALDVDELEETAQTVRRMILERAHRGTGGIRAWYPQTIAAWRTAHAGDSELDRLMADFCRSASAGEWRDAVVGAPGLSLEEALYRFFDENDVGDAAVREEEFLGAIVRALAVTPRARFIWPATIRRAPGGCFALTGELVLHAAIDGRYLRGVVTSLIARVLLGETVDDTPPRAVEQVRAQLRAMRLIADCP
jgi:hypothetical protein